MTDTETETQAETPSSSTTPTEGPESTGAQTDGSSSTAPRVAGDTAVPTGQPFALEVGETAVLEDGLEVEFESVVGDSRCPEDVTCVWEGNAEIAIEVVKTGENPASLRLNTNPRFATEAAYLTYTIKLVDLEPYPRTDSEADEPYRATLAVETNEEP